MKDENIQILAKNLEIKDNIVNATGDVIVYSVNYYITANKLLYDKENGKLELFGDVNIIKNDEVVSYSQYMFIDINKDINNFKPMLVLDKTNKIWFNAENGLKDKDIFDLKNSTLSSCDCEDPAWSIKFSSGDMNTTTQWVNTYNTTLYINNFPILYTPYFGFPTDDTRRTGLTSPTVGYSKSEGLLFAQPIYFAPQLNYDFEYIPQVRTQRGYGHTLKYRYKDSLYSTLNIEAGMFKEQTKYFNEMNLINEKHYGWDLDYKRSKLFSKKDTSDGLLVKYTDMNDVDYLDTQPDSKSLTTTDQFIESKAKYFYNTNSYYGDIEVNLYNKLKQDSNDLDNAAENDKVLQTLPKVNFHKYTDGFFNNLFTSSVNLSSTRETRKVGVGANTTDIYIPIGYHHYLADELLNFSFTEQISYTNVAYDNTNIYKDANYAENNHVFSLYTDLVKPYNNFIHTTKFGISYTDVNIFKESGDIYNSGDSSTDELSPFAITQTTKNIALSFNQSFYNKTTLKEIVNHKISQSYIYSDNTNGYEKYTTENDLRYNYDYGYIANRLIYNHEIKDVSLSSTSFTFSKDAYFLNMYYSYLQNKKNKNDEDDEDKLFNYDFGLKFGKYYSLAYKEEYDLLTHESKRKEYIFNIDEKCWGINFKVIDSLVPSDTTSSNGAYRQKILYLEFNLKELFLMEQEYELNEREQNED
ncbi:MAG: LPS-assembly protein LptD [Arcobacteraceae bacterium]